MNEHELLALLKVWKVALGYAPQHTQRVRHAIVDIIDNMLATEAGKVELKPYFTDEEIDYILAGKKLFAIKAVKNRLGLSLMEAKEYVENHGGQILVEAIARRRYTS